MVTTPVTDITVVMVTMAIPDTTVIEKRKQGKSNTLYI